MRLLLDTHVFLWLLVADSRLPATWADAITDPQNDVFLSVASVWEALVKHGVGNLPLPQPPEIYRPAQPTRHQIESLALDEASVSRLATLPSPHRDPFDRMIICQAIEHSLTVVTVDPIFAQYPVPLLPRV